MDIIPIANYTESDTHMLGVAKTAHLLRMLHRSIDYAQEVRRKHRCLQARHQQAPPSMYGMPSAPSLAPSSFVPMSVASMPAAGGTQVASLTRVSA